MSATPADLFCRYFAELERQGIAYAILHSYETYPAVIATDVDYAVPHAELDRARRLQGEVAAGCGWVVAQEFQHEYCAFYAVLIDPQQPRSFLKLDVCSHYVRNGSCYLRAAELVAGRRRAGDFWVAAPAVECVYTLTKALAKGKPVADHLARARSLCQAAPAEAERLWARVYGAGAAPLAAWWDRAPAEWDRLAQGVRARCRYTPGQWAAEWRRRWRRCRAPTGLVVAVLGSDGVGKTSLIGALRELLEPCFRRQRARHFRPQFFESADGGAVTEPHAQPARAPLFCWLKVLYYVADYWLGFWLTDGPARLRGVVVVYDRYFDDLLVDPVRYRLQRSRRWVRWLRPLVPGPDLMLVLDAAPARIRSRKPELDLAELERQRSALRDLAAGAPRAVVVEADGPPAAVARAAAGAVIGHLARRLRQRETGR